jgi:hypothetical protein
VLASGLLMLVMDLRAGRIALRELAGAAVLAKLLLVVWMAVDRPHAAWALALLVLFSSVTSHAPKNVRHWPSPDHKRAKKGVEARVVRGRDGHLLRQAAALFATAQRVHIGRAIKHPVAADQGHAARQQAVGQAAQAGADQGQPFG